MQPLFSSCTKVSSPFIYLNFNMRKTSLLSLLLLCIWYTSTSSRRDPNNPPTARTGAPGETTCGASGCHNGGAFVGSVEISGIPDTVVANTTYSVTLKQTSNAVRGGFQMTCLDSLNKRCGTFTTGSGTSIGNVNSTGRQYIRQSTPKTLSGGSTSWTFTWKAPATAAGNDLKCYFVSLAANGNGEKTGDNVLIAADTMVFVEATSGLKDLSQDHLINLYPSRVNDVLHIDLDGFDNANLRIYSVGGTLVYSTTLASAKNTIMVNQLPKGTYVAQVEIGDETIAKRFVK